MPRLTTSPPPPTLHLRVPQTMFLVKFSGKTKDVTMLWLIVDVTYWLWCIMVVICWMCRCDHIVVDRGCGRLVEVYGGCYAFVVVDPGCFVLIVVGCGCGAFPCCGLRVLCFDY